MLRYILVYGALPGAIVITAMIVGFTLFSGQPMTGMEWLGFLIMFLAFSLIFVGVKRYRDTANGGVIKFMPALGLGLAMAAVAGVVYVAIWEIYLTATGHRFIEQYTAGMIEAKKAAGVEGEKLDEIVRQMTLMAENYGDPLFRLPITFIEIFPIGLIVAVVSAAILRNPKAFPPKK